MPNPFAMLANTLFMPMVNAIMATWRAAKEHAFSRIRDEIAAEADAGAVEETLAELREQAPAAIEDKAKGKKK